MEGLGRDVVLSKLAYGHAGNMPDDDVRIGVPPFPRRKFVEAWLFEKNRAAEAAGRRNASIVEWTLIASAIAAIAAVIAVIQGWHH